MNPNHRNFIGEQDADKFLLELAIELKCFPTELFKDPIKHLKDICEVVNNFPLNTTDTEIDILEDTKKTLAIVHANKPAIKTIKLAEYLHNKKFDVIINQKEKLDLSIKPISRILASAYLGKALDFLAKNNNQFEICLEQALETDPKFYQAYAQIGSQLLVTKQQKDIEKAIDYFIKCLEIKPDLKNDAIIGNYAIALSNLARIKQDESLFEQAFEQYQKALKIQPEHADHLGNYGSALAELAHLKQDESLFAQAFEQYQKALKIQPEHADHLGNYGNALSGLARLKLDESLFEQAFEVLQKALKIQPNNTYNLACYYSLTQQTELTKENLLHAEQHQTLPYNSYKHLNEDKDLDHIRQETWFIELLERLKNLETTV